MEKNAVIHTLPDDGEPRIAYFYDHKGNPAKVSDYDVVVITRTVAILKDKHGPQITLFMGSNDQYDWLTTLFAAFKLEDLQLAVETAQQKLYPRV